MVTPLDNLSKYRIILASGSPRRRELMSLLDIDFEVNTSIDVDESHDGISSREVAPFLSRVKADAYRALLTSGGNELVITADTVVILDDKVLGKPRDSREAVGMLSALSGRVHEVITGVTVMTAGKTVTFSATSKVEFAPLSTDEIEYYVNRFRPLDKAGAYGIQEWIGAAGIRGIDGSFYNVMGLPVHRLYDTLKEF
ncbi:MAG: Maf family nucleotide pyrophosphatase [Duncaniella sp.]|nr:Maf family nucleotide pyrophosphatase [Duncaniella sp.]